ncbi:hypothetical protein pb186bvf_018978 [Paramecium bursaria]
MGTCCHANVIDAQIDLPQSNQFPNQDQQELKEKIVIEDLHLYITDDRNDEKIEQISILDT